MLAPTEAYSLSIPRLSSTLNWALTYTRRGADKKPHRRQKRPNAEESESVSTQERRRAVICCLAKEGETDHVKDGDDWETRRPGLLPLALDAASLRNNARRTRAPVAAPERVPADDKVLVRIQRLARTDKLFPPTRGGVGSGRGGVGGGGQAGVEEDRIGPVGVELAPGLVGDCERR